MDDIASETGQTPGNANKNGMIVVGPAMSLFEFGAMIARAQVAALQGESTELFRDAHGAARTPIPTAYEAAARAIEGEHPCATLPFFGRGFPLQSRERSVPPPPTTPST